MSLTTDAHGNLLVLDQVNHRIARFSPDGHPLAPISLPVRAAQDLAVARDGTIAVLDRLGDSTVALVAPDGSVRAQIPLVGNGIPEGGGTTGIFVDGDDVYVEREHGPLVLIGDVSGQQDEGRTEIPGRPTRDGSAFISAGLIDAPTGRFYVNSVARDTRENRFTRALQVPLVLHNILLLDTDRAGTIYVAVSGETPGATDPNAANESALLLCLDPAEGRPTGQATLPVNAGPDETFREMTVLDGGGVVMSVDTEDGVTLEQFNCS